MRICQITPGISEIPPKGWGAIEKVIWNYKRSFERIGHSCEIKYLSDVNPGEYDIVHIHVANLAIEAHKRGIPYIFSLHDHHVFRFGKNSELYRINLDAIKNSIVSFSHAEFITGYFDGSDKIFYLPHGVDTDLYKKNKGKTKKEHSLLCLANNGYSDSPSYDRKGFRYAIEAAKKLSLPITIAGPEGNMRFFEENPDLLEGGNVNLVLSNLPEDKIIDIYSDHTIFLHPSELEAGHPNLTILEAISCGIPVVGVYDGSFKIEPLIKCERNTESVVLGVIEAIKNYPKYLDLCQTARKNIDWDVVCTKILSLYIDLDNCRNEISSEDFGKKISNLLNEVKISGIQPRSDIKFNVNYINGPFIEISGNSGLDYDVDFIDKDGRVEYSASIGCNMWSRLNKKYYSEHRIEVRHKDSLVFSTTCNPGGKKIFITLESKALGDTLAWIPYVDEFRKKHKCQVVCSTFLNDLFIEVYPDITFVPPGTVVDGIYAMYNIGWFYKDGVFDRERNPVDFKFHPLQKTASDILGLEYKEIKPPIKLPDKKKKKRVGLGIQSTAQAKYWNNPEGWQEVTDYLISIGYEVVVYSKEENGYMGNFYPKGSIQNQPGSIHKLMEDLSTCEFFIGISSGISWVTWALGIPTILISGFTEEFNEPYENVYKIGAPKNVCSGCANKFRLDPGDWNWCPVHKGTERAFECTREIKSGSVIEIVEKLINKT